MWREEQERKRLGAAHFVDLFGLKPTKKEDLAKESQGDELGIKLRRRTYKGANNEIFTAAMVKNCFCGVAVSLRFLPKPSTDLGLSETIFSTGAHRC